MKAFRMMTVALLSLTAFVAYGGQHDNPFFDLIGQQIRDHIDVAYAVSSPIVALNAYAGKYERRLFSTMFNEMDIANDVTVLRSVKSKIQMTKLEVGDGARPYEATPQGRGTINYTPRVLEAELWKREEPIEIKKYYKTWLEEELAKGEGSSATQETLPFAEQTWNLFFKKIGQELNDKTAYFGFDKLTATVYSGAATYAVGDKIIFTAADGITDYWNCLVITTAGQTPITHPAKWQKVNAEAICVGLGTRLAADITAGSVVPTTTGAINNTSVFAYESFNELFRALPIAYRRYGVVAYCSYTDYDFLRDDMEDKVSKYTEKEMNAPRGLYLPKTDRQCLVMPCNWMTGSRRIILTPKENLLMGTDLMSDANTLEMTKNSAWVADYAVSGNLGFQIRDPKALVCNDQV